MTAERPLVSVGIPVYNGEPFIREALSSILAQTYSNLEVIISDNASTDSTAAICQDYAARDQRIRYYRNAVNININANFRRVLKLSSGDYFIWAAADDVRPKTAVQDCLMALLSNKDAVMAHGPILVKVIGTEKLTERTNEVWLSDLSVFRRIRAFTKGIEHNGILYGLCRRDALAKCNFRDTLGDDYLLCLQMCLLGPMEYVRSPMIIFYQGQPCSPNPMYRTEPITLMNLLIGGGPRKCWVVLILGCFHLLKIRGVSFSDRAGAVVAHLSSFLARYRSRLAKEIVLQLFTPVAWLFRICLRVARRSRPSLILTHKIKAVLLRPVKLRTRE